VCVCARVCVCGLVWLATGFATGFPDKDFAELPSFEEAKPASSKMNFGYTVVCIWLAICCCLRCMYIVLIFAIIVIMVS